jgi:hypothetical protein
MDNISPMLRTQKSRNSYGYGLFNISFHFNRKIKSWNAIENEAICSILLPYSLDR